MSLELEPDVAFGATPEFGIAAAVADDRPFLDEVLRKHHFAYNARLDVYLLPSDTAHHTAVKAVAAATHEFQDAGLPVAADPRAVVPPDRKEPAPRPGQPPDALNDEARELREAAGISEVIRGAMDEGIGAVEELDDLVDTATTWCDRLDSAQGREMALHLRSMKHLVTSLNDHVMNAVMELEDMSRGVFRNAPAPSDVPAREGHKELPEHHAACSRAATASSPQHPEPTPQSALHQPAPPALAQPSEHRRTR
ncbi:hypothetical protein [Streptomyces iconiensis]|uniref:Uncharacterized protein n=1 Tax=Streptomyces iconiensis TaxID=1384038 RepID=A0ABT6ZSG2_9ACTN|nr:hypothetical protein [Streptomyces iconiensis]MDJ1132003.1 hypothetical protein [Streptomyces iconiensis]